MLYYRNNQNRSAPIEIVTDVLSTKPWFAANTKVWLLINFKAFFEYIIDIFH